MKTYWEEIALIALIITLACFIWSQGVSEKELTALEIIEETHVLYWDECNFLLEQNGGDIQGAEFEARANNLKCNYK